jgi:tetratricopeptide (TPR) repeat protein
MTPIFDLQLPSADVLSQRLVPPAKVILRRASGYIELGELLLEGEAAAPPTACRLFARALVELTQLDAATRQEAAASLLEGEALRALGEWEAAIPPLTRAAEATPGHVEAWLGLGWCLKRLDHLGAAIDALRRGLGAFPDQPILHYNLACYHSLAGNVPAAIEQLTQAIAIDDRFRDLTGNERDFDAIRSDPRFVAATSVTV